MSNGLSAQQIEARTIGTQLSTVRWLTNRGGLAIIFFLLILVSGALWAAVIFNVVENIYYYTTTKSKNDTISNTCKKPLPWYILFSTATIWTVLSWSLVRYAFKLPITAAFGF